LAALTESLTNLSSRLAAVGRRDDALAAIEGGVAIYRRVAHERQSPVSYFRWIAHVP
jgi:hypothetical protein